MSWWGEQKTNQPAIAVAVDREAELREELRSVETALHQLNDEMKQFRTEYSLQTDGANRIVSMRCASMNGRSAAERTWCAFNARVNQLVPKRNAILRELAILTVAGFTEEATR